MRREAAEGGIDGGEQKSLVDEKRKEEKTTSIV